MIVLNLILMTTVIAGIVSLLTWAIVSDRRSKRAGGGELAPPTARLHHNLVMPHELRAHRGARAHSARAPQVKTRASMA
jgi:hypothetical protein